jgi:hypothetical protein
MKKILTTAVAVFTVAAIIATVSNDRTKQFSDLAYVQPAKYDTVPSDTTSPDSTVFGMLAYNVLDTVPSDTTSPDSAFAAFAYNMVRDTVPSDTTSPDSTFSAFAYNIVRDTVPSDTTTPDSTFKYLAMLK